jgi:hypothetical protein
MSTRLLSVPARLLLVGLAAAASLLAAAPQAWAQG